MLPAEPSYLWRTFKSLLNRTLPALSHPPPLSVYTPPSKITCPPQKILLYLNQKQTFMNTLLIMGWASLATWAIPNAFKDEDLRYGMRLVLVSMSIGVLIGALVF
jgi:hypothetical protein